MRRAQGEYQERTPLKMTFDSNQSIKYEEKALKRRTFPFLTKYRGDSGRMNSPVAKIMAHKNWIAIGIR